MTSQFPLGSVSIAHLQQLGEVIWSWSICEDCISGKSCKTKGCPWPRSTALSRFFDFYKLITSLYECHVENGQKPGLECHEDLFNIIRQMKASPELTKSELLNKLFTNRPIREDQEQALYLAARITMMINCTSPRHSLALLEHGYNRIFWRMNATFAQFFEDAFQMNYHPNIEIIKESLRGTKLKKHARLRFQATNDLANHLRLDRKTAVVEIFHHTAFLKEHLRFTRDLQPQNLSRLELANCGAIPRELALEVLDSIQKVLFPLADSDSHKLLESLTSTRTSNIDPDVLRYVSTAIRRPEEEHVSYRYFGCRLADLHQEMLNPTPRGMEKWFERNSGARSVMMATIAGVIFAIFLGILALAVGVFQAWVSYMAWKHPVNS